MCPICLGTQLEAVPGNPGLKRCATNGCWRVAGDGAIFQVCGLADSMAAVLDDILNRAGMSAGDRSIVRDGLVDRFRRMLGSKEENPSDTSWRDIATEPHVLARFGNRGRLVMTPDNTFLVSHNSGVERYALRAGQLYEIIRGLNPALPKQHGDGRHGLVFVAIPGRPGQILVAAPPTSMQFLKDTTADEFVDSRIPHQFSWLVVPWQRLHEVALRVLSEMGQLLVRTRPNQINTGVLDADIYLRDLTRGGIAHRLFTQSGLAPNINVRALVAEEFGAGMAAQAQIIEGVN